MIMAPIKGVGNTPVPSGTSVYVTKLGGKGKGTELTLSNGIKAEVPVPVKDFVIGGKVKPNYGSIAQEGGSVIQACLPFKEGQVCVYADQSKDARSYNNGNPPTMVTTDWKQGSKNQAGEWFFRNDNLSSKTTSYNDQGWRIRAGSFETKQK
jgi:hypothetical protein